MRTAMVPSRARTRHPSESMAGTTPDDDARYLVIDGRRWRRSDPAIPEALRTELVAELMDARRAVGSARRAHDAEAEARARARVAHAKLALGERGTPWWEEPTEAARRARAVAVAHTLLRHRGPDKTICPSDIARVLSGTGFRAHLALVRDVVAELADARRLEVRQKGKVVDARAARGPIRIAAVREP